MLGATRGSCLSYHHPWLPILTLTWNILLLNMKLVAWVLSFCSNGLFFVPPTSTLLLNVLGSDERGVWSCVAYSLLSPWLLGAPKNVVDLSLTRTCLYFPCSPALINLLYVRTTIWLFSSSNHGANSPSTVCAGLNCVQRDSLLVLRRKGLVVSSIWEGSARHSPCLPCASALLLHIVLLLHEMDSQTRVEWEVWGPSHGKA